MENGMEMETENRVWVKHDTHTILNCGCFLVNHRETLPQGEGQFEI